MLIEKVIEVENIYIVNDDMFVPKSPDNRDYQEIQKWFEAGNKPTKEGDNIDSLKAEKLSELSVWQNNMTEKSKINLKGFGDIDGGYKYLLNVRAMKNNFELLPMKVFRMYDNSFKEVTLEDLAKIETAIEFGGIMLHSLKWQYETAIDGAKSKEQLDAIVFTDVINVDLSAKTQKKSKS